LIPSPLVRLVRPRHRSSPPRSSSPARPLPSSLAASLRPDPRDDREPRFAVLPRRRARRGPCSARPPRNADGGVSRSPRPRPRTTSRARIACARSSQVRTRLTEREHDHHPRSRPVRLIRKNPPPPAHPRRCLLVTATPPASRARVASTARRNMCILHLHPAAMTGAGTPASVTLSNEHRRATPLPIPAPHPWRAHALCNHSGPPLRLAGHRRRPLDRGGVGARGALP